MPAAVGIAPARGNERLIYKCTKLKSRYILFASCARKVIFAPSITTQRGVRVVEGATLER